MLSSSCLLGWLLDGSLQHKNKCIWINKFLKSTLACLLVDLWKQHLQGSSCWVELLKALILIRAEDMYCLLLAFGHEHMQLVWQWLMQWWYCCWNYMQFRQCFTAHYFACGWTSTLAWECSTSEQKSWALSCVEDFNVTVSCQPTWWSHFWGPVAVASRSTVVKIWCGRPELWGSWMAELILLHVKSCHTMCPFIVTWHTIGWMDYIFLHPDSDCLEQDATNSSSRFKG